MTPSTEATGGSGSSRSLDVAEEEAAGVFDAFLARARELPVGKSWGNQPPNSSPRGGVQLTLPGNTGPR
jgi:hypothetical protein